jgi:hypothetical protein
MSGYCLNSRGDRLRDGVDQLARGKRLAQAGDATGLKSLLPNGFVIERSHKDDWKRRTGRLKSLPQFNPGQSTKMNVQEKAIRIFFESTGEEFLCRSEERGNKPISIQQVCGSLEHARIVIHDGDYRTSFLHGDIGCCFGEAS